MTKSERTALVVSRMGGDFALFLERYRPDLHEMRTASDNLQIRDESSLLWTDLTRVLLDLTNLQHHIHEVYGDRGRDERKAI